MYNKMHVYCVHSTSFNNYVHSANYQTKQDTEHFNKHRKFFHAFSSNPCFDFCQQRLVLPVLFLNFICRMSYFMPGLFYAV